MRFPAIQEGISVSYLNVGSTNPEMIRLLADLSRSDVWDSFLVKYTPLITRYCGKRALSEEESNEIYSRVMLILVNTFGCKETRIQASFRGYLSKIISNEINKFLIEKRDALVFSSLEFTPEDSLDSNVEFNNDELESFEQLILYKMELLNRIFQSVRIRVEKITWRIFWDITVKGIEYEEVARKRHKSYLAVIQSNRRVIEMIRKEASKHGIFGYQEDWGSHDES
jgi:hypothetical protein